MNEEKQKQLESIADRLLEKAAEMNSLANEIYKLIGTGRIDDLANGGNSVNNIPVNIVIRGVEALESIANSLSTLAEDTKASKELKETLIENVNDMQSSIERLKSDPFGLNEGD